MCVVVECVFVWWCVYSQLVIGSRLLLILNWKEEASSFVLFVLFECEKCERECEQSVHLLSLSETKEEEQTPPLDFVLCC